MALQHVYRQPVSHTVSQPSAMQNHVIFTDGLMCLWIATILSLLCVVTQCKVTVCACPQSAAESVAKSASLRKRAQRQCRLKAELTAAGEAGCACAVVCAFYSPMCQVTCSVWQCTSQHFTSSDKDATVGTHCLCTDHLEVSSPPVSHHFTTHAMQCLGLCSQWPHLWPPMLFNCRRQCSFTHRT